MKSMLFLIFFCSSIAFAYEVYDPASGGTIYVKWCDPVRDEINDLHYIKCGDSSDKKITVRGSCSNLQNNCGQASPSYPVQTGDSLSKKMIKTKKQWEYFNLKQAEKVGYPASYQPASIDTTDGKREKEQKKNPSMMEKAIKKP